MKKQFGKKFWTAAVGLMAAAALFCYWQNNDLTVSRWELESSQVPEGFDGYTIVQISDLHNKSFGAAQVWLLETLEAEKPDLIVLTGDLIDSRNTDVDTALQLAQQAVKLAPCYYVTGNHESRVAEFAELKAGLQACGVTVLENEKVILERDGSTVTLAGVQDPAFGADYLLGGEEAVMEAQLVTLLVEENGFTVLLSHRPEFFDLYVECGVDLVFSGHAHGGQWRLPGVGGLIAPGQGFFPKYTAGPYSASGDDGGQDTVMYVSRGLGNSLMPVRIFNRPELVVVKLKIQ